MPNNIQGKGYRFIFFSREESRMHVHVTSGDGEAKFWLEPEIQLAKNYREHRCRDVVGAETYASEDFLDIGIHRKAHDSANSDGVRC